MNEILKIQSFIDESVEKLGASGVVIGISGGIDSAVSASLSARALGKDRVLGVLLPERDSSREAVFDGLRVCESIGINCLRKPITRALRALGAYKLQPPAGLFPRTVQERYVKKKWSQYEKEEDVFIMDLLNRGDDRFRRGLAFYRAKNRMRMCKLYLEAECRGFSVLGATNKTEYYMGLYVKWGDEAVDIEPIMHLFKSEVIEIAKELEIPQEIITKAPSADLIPGMADQDILKIGYDELDSVLRQIENGTAPDKEPHKRIRRIICAAGHRRLKALNLLLRNSR